MSLVMVSVPAPIHTQLYTGQRIQSVRLLFQRFICHAALSTSNNSLPLPKKEFRFRVSTASLIAATKSFPYQCRSQHFGTIIRVPLSSIWETFWGWVHWHPADTAAGRCTGQAGLIIRTVTLFIVLSPKIC